MVCHGLGRDDGFRLGDCSLCLRLREATEAAVADLLAVARFDLNIGMVVEAPSASATNGMRRQKDDDVRVPGRDVSNSSFHAQWRLPTCSCMMKKRN